MKTATKQLAKQIARQMAQEPFEMLKDVRRQVFPNPESSPNADGMVSSPIEQPKAAKVKDTRTLTALNNEIEDIRKHNVYKDLVRKVSQGEEVYVHQYSELTLEQKQVLIAQMEATKANMANSQISNNNLREPSSKKGRRLFSFGRKGEAEKLQTRVEKPVPPSG